MIISKAGAAALASFGAIAIAPSPAFAAEQKQPGVFLQCDGRIGHVSGGERFMRLLLVTATAGISEAGMSRDDAEKRAKGVAGVAACDQALASEGDGYRRIQLALARPLHFGEDKKWEDAAVAAQAVPQQLGARAADWGLSKSATSTAHYLQAVYLIRAGRVAEAEAAAWDGVREAGLDVVTLQRMSKFAWLSRTISPEKRAALMTMQRYLPDTSLRVATAFGEAGDFAAASSTVRGLDSIIQAFAKEPKPITGTHALLAGYSAMNGDIETAKAEYAIAKTAFEKDRAEGDAASKPTEFARNEELLAFAEAAMATASGDSAQAAKLLAARGAWPNIAAGVVARLVGRIAPEIPERDRQGVVAKGEEALWKEALEARIAVLTNSEKDDSLWAVTGLLAQDVNYQKLAKQAESGSSAKPKWLLKPGKEPRNFDIISTSFNVQGWEAGEGILYHAALIAKARGKQGFVLFPDRKKIEIVGLRFVNLGELGIPASSIVMADEVIAALSPYIRVVQP